MSDLRFDEVVLNGHSRMNWDKDEREYIALCGSCGTYHKASATEFRFPRVVDVEALSYLAKKVRGTVVTKTKLH